MTYPLATIHLRGIIRTARRFSLSAGNKEPWRRSSGIGTACNIAGTSLRLFAAYTSVLHELTVQPHRKEFSQELFRRQVRVEES
jgi:hypothetical protein